MTENNSDTQAPAPDGNPTTEERILWEQEKQRIQLNRIAEATQAIAEVLRSDAPAQEPDPLSDQLSPIETLQTHMEAHGVNTQKVEMEVRTQTNEKAEAVGQGPLWFDNVYDEMTDDENEEFREYTMEMEFVEVDEWVQYGKDDDGEPLNRPDGYVVELADLEGLV